MMNFNQVFKVGCLVISGCGVAGIFKLSHDVKKSSEYVRKELRDIDGNIARLRANDSHGMDILAKITKKSLKTLESVVKYDGYGSGECDGCDGCREDADAEE